MKKPIFWLFCTVIDNFGDVGVAWRLARELRMRLNARVFLWLDDWSILNLIAPYWHDDEIIVLPWQEGKTLNLQGIDVPDVVIETFACSLPDEVIQTIRSQAAIWLNWEYLSAEDWAVRTHLMPSIQHDGTTKFFWQMGFLPETGGLLRESDYQTRYRLHQNKQPEKYLPSRWLIFAYDDVVWTKWAKCWQVLQQPIQLVLASEQVLHRLQADGVLPLNVFSGCREYVSGCLTWELAHFVPQSDFDELLWNCDGLIVRGEDSFVRAQLAGKPFFWHIYPQENLAHLDKLQAFWRLPQRAFPMPMEVHLAFEGLSGELNGAWVLTDEVRLHHWRVLLANWQAWQAQAKAWQSFLWQQDDAVSRLQQFLQQCDTLATSAQLSD